MTTPLAKLIARLEREDLKITKQIDSAPGLEQAVASATQRFGLRVALAMARQELEAEQDHTQQET